MSAAAPAIDSPPAVVEPEAELHPTATMPSPGLPSAVISETAEPSRGPLPTAIPQPAEPIDMRLLIGIDIGCLIVTAALALAVAFNAGGAARLLLALAFTSAVPGWALVRGLGLAGTPTGVAIVVPSSLAICAGASVLMVWIHAWQPLVLLAGLAAVSAAVIGWMLRIQVSNLPRSPDAIARR